MPRLHMPGFEDLTPDQDRVLRLPDDGRYLIYGPPGTGKTVVALLRAVAMRQRNRPPCILMYNRLLNDYCQQMLARRSIRLEVQRYHRWFVLHYKRHYGEWPPECVGADGCVRRFRYDWPSILHACAARNPPVAPSSTPLFIDEGQDLAPGFYEYAGLHFSHIMVFADENQMLNETENSTLATICEKLLIPEAHRLRLHINQRNTQQIARVAEQFYVGLESGKPDIPNRVGPVPYLIDYADVRFFAERILRHVRLHPQFLVAVVTANNRSQDIMRAQLEPLCRRSQVAFQVYRSAHPTRVDFSAPGIILLNQQSLKGLEFDSVLIADLHEHYIRRDSSAHKMILYVATSRARERLYLLHDRTRECPVLADMPGPEVLNRSSLDRTR